MILDMFAHEENLVPGTVMAVQQSGDGVLMVWAGVMYDGHPNRHFFQ